MRFIYSLLIASLAVVGLSVAHAQELQKPQDSDRDFKYQVVLSEGGFFFHTWAEVQSLERSGEERTLESIAMCKTRLFVDASQTTCDGDEFLVEEGFTAVPTHTSATLTVKADATRVSLKCHRIAPPQHPIPDMGYPYLRCVEE